MDMVNFQPQPLFNLDRVIHKYSVVVSSPPAASAFWLFTLKSAKGCPLSDQAFPMRTTQYLHPKRQMPLRMLQCAARTTTLAFSPVSMVEVGDWDMDMLGILREGLQSASVEGSESTEPRSRGSETTAVSDVGEKASPQPDVLDRDGIV